MSKLTIETSDAKNLAALLMAFTEFKISTVTLRLGTALVAEVESTASFQDVPRPPKGFQDEITICATFDSDTRLAKNPAKSSMTSLLNQADWSPYSVLQIACEKEASREPFQHYWDCAQEYGHRSANTVASYGFSEPYHTPSQSWRIFCEEEASCEPSQHYWNRAQEYGHRSAYTLASHELWKPYYYYTSQSFPSLNHSRFDVDAMGSIARMIWTDECFRTAPYIIVYRRCPLSSKPARLFSFNGVHWRGFWIKDWQNAHGKVGRAKLR